MYNKVEISTQCSLPIHNIITVATNDLQVEGVNVQASLLAVYLHNTAIDYRSIVGLRKQTSIPSIGVNGAQSRIARGEIRRCANYRPS